MEVQANVELINGSHMRVTFVTKAGVTICETPTFPVGHGALIAGTIMKTIFTKCNRQARRLARKGFAQALGMPLSALSKGLNDSPKSVIIKPD